MKHFSESEFVMGGENVFDKMDESFLILLDELRENVNRPLRINSSFRTVEYNEVIQKKANKNYIPYSSKSKHMKGIAVDISCRNGILRSKIVRHALDLGLTVGVASTFVHIDDRENQIVFSY